MSLNPDNWNQPWTWQDQEAFEYLVKHKFSSVTIQKLMRRPIGTVYSKRRELREKAQ